MFIFGNKLNKVEKCVEKKKVAALINLSGEKDIAVSTAAIRGLGRCGGDEAYNALIPFLRDSKAEKRAAAANALGMLGRQTARVHLQHQLDVEKDQQAISELKKAMLVLQK